MARNTTRNRRQFIKSVGVSGAIVGLAGCVDDSGGDGSGGDGDDGGNGAGGGGDGGDGGDGGTTDDGSTDGDESIVFGTLAPNSGTFSSSGPYVAAGNELAVQQINEEGGIDGTEVEVVVADTETTPEAGASGATRLIEQDDVDFLSGAVSSGVGLAVADIAEENEVPYNSGIASLVFGTETCPSYVFANNPSTHMTTNAYIPYFADQGAESFYFINADYTWGQNAAEFYNEIVPELGAEFAGESFAPFGANDFSSQITNALNSGADTLILTLFGTDITRCINQLIQYNAREEFDTIATVVNSIQLNRGMNELEGFMFGGKYYWGVDSDANRAFVEAYEAENGEKPPMAAALQYGSTYEMLRAAQEAGSADGDAVAETLEGWTADPFYKGGRAEFRACDHRLVSDIFLMEGKAEGDRESEDDLLTVVERFEGEGLARDCSETCDNLPAWS